MLPEPGSVIYHYKMGFSTPTGYSTEDLLIVSVFLCLYGFFSPFFGVVAFCWLLVALAFSFGGFGLFASGGFWWHVLPLLVDCERQAHKFDGDAD